MLTASKLQNSCSTPNFRFIVAAKHACYRYKHTLGAIIAFANYPY